MKTYLVGGAVRDDLLGRSVAEKDYVVVGATPDEMLEKGFMQVGQSFPVFLHPVTKDEYALARTECKIGPGYKGFKVHASPEVTLEQDLQRRDLTINAMARDSDGKLIDPYGGQSDLANRLLRHVSPAFAEDPLRVLRVARFAARYAGLGFQVARETLELMRGMVEAGEVDALVPERVWQELARALGEENPSVFFRVLDQCGAMSHLFPEIERSKNALSALDTATKLTNQPEIRFAALTHDLGEARGPIDNLCDRLKAPRRFHDLALLVSRYNKQVHQGIDFSSESILRLLTDTDALRRPERFAQFLKGCEAVYLSRRACRGKSYFQAELLQRSLKAVRTLDIGALTKNKRDPEQIQREVREKRLAAIQQVVGQRIRSGDEDS